MQEAQPGVIRTRPGREIEPGGGSISRSAKLTESEPACPSPDAVAAAQDRLDRLEGRIAGLDETTAAELREIRAIQARLDQRVSAIFSALAEVCDYAEVPIREPARKPQQRHLSLVRDPDRGLQVGPSSRTGCTRPGAGSSACTRRAGLGRRARASAAAMELASPSRASAVPGSLPGNHGHASHSQTCPRCRRARRAALISPAVWPSHLSSNFRATREWLACSYLSCQKVVSFHT